MKNILLLDERYWDSHLGPQSFLGFWSPEENWGFSGWPDFNKIGITYYFFVNQQVKFVSQKNPTVFNPFMRDFPAKVLVLESPKVLFNNLDCYF